MTVQEVSPQTAAANAAVTPDWDAIRKQFPTLGHFTYLDTAKKAILPRHVETAITEWMADVYENAGGRAFSMEAVEEARDAAAALLGVSPRHLALIKNTSEGMNIIAQGLPFARGDNVVISEYEHENNTFPWRKLTEKGVEVRWARPDKDGRIPTEHYAQVVDERTRVVAAAWVAYGNGFRTDIAALAQLCHGKGARLVVDGMQAVGFLATPLPELGADAVVAGGHKALFSLAGAGFMYVSEDFLPEITPVYGAKFSYTSNDRMQAAPQFASDAHRFEYGNPNFLGCWVQKHSADWLRNLGLHHIEARIRELTTYLIDKAEACGVKVRTPRAWEERAAIVSFDLPGDAVQIVRDLRTRRICVSEKDGHVRAAVHFYNNVADLDRLLENLRP